MSTFAPACSTYLSWTSDGFCIYTSFFVAVSQAQTFQEDFEQERKDREKAHGQVGNFTEAVAPVALMVATPLTDCL